ncbi:MAG: exonuclease SbcCD subunit D [Candidatus Hydrogenedentota bacterium]
MKLIHTADVHLDRCFASSRVPPRQAKWRRQLLRELFLDMLRRAADTRADAVLIAGDLFEAHYVTRETIAFVQEACYLAAPVPILIAPGNRDPVGPHSPYAAAPWPENVHIFRSPQWETIELPHAALAVHGFAFDASDPAASSLDHLSVPAESGRVHVALGHGTAIEDGATAGGAVAPFDVNAATPQGIAYLALGHVHDRRAIANDRGVPAWYCGSLDCLGFDAAGECGYLEVRIEEEHGSRQVHVEPVHTARTRYVTRDLDCSDLSNLVQIAEALRGLGRSLEGEVMARIRLCGRRPDHAPIDRTQLAQNAAEAYTFLELEDATEPPEDLDALAREHASLGVFVDRLNHELADTLPPERAAMVDRARALGIEAYRRHAPATGDEES